MTAIYDDASLDVLDKLRKLLGGGTKPASTGRIKTGNVPRRPAKPRAVRGQGGGVAATGPAGGLQPRPRAASGMPSLPLGPLGSAGHEPKIDIDIQAEIPCPNCGEPMLPGWGTTCGKCRPHLVAAKTMFLAPGQVALPPQAGGGMTLGWLVVVRSVDERQRGTLIELDRDRVVLSRAGSAPQGPDRLVGFDDSYMSSAHAVLGRPSADRQEAFTIRDRENPASANGTFVNSQRLGAGEVVRLGDGDIIKVGATELLFKSLWLPPVGSR